MSIWEFLGNIFSRFSILDLVDIALVKSEREIMTKGQAVPEHMRSGTQGDFTGLPPLHFYYGGDAASC